MTDRDAFFRSLHDRIRDWYLAEPDNPYRMSGRTSGARRWEETRLCLVEAIDRDGDFLDIGCANGFLLETLREAAPFELTPYGIDFVAELVEHARLRHPAFEENFVVANVWDWDPGRRFDYVRTNLEYLPESDWPEYLRRVASYADRLIVCHYHQQDEQPANVVEVMRDAGLDIAGCTVTPGNAFCWTERA